MVPAANINKKYAVNLSALYRRHNFNTVIGHKPMLAITGSRHKFAVDGYGDVIAGVTPCLQRLLHGDRFPQGFVFAVYL